MLGEMVAYPWECLGDSFGECSGEVQDSTRKDGQGNGVRSFGVRIAGNNESREQSIGFSNFKKDCIQEVSAQPHRDWSC